MKECNSCGKCCTKYGGGRLSASQAEIEYWDIFRPDIAAYVKNGEIWFSPETGTLIERCPWLNKLPGKDIFTCDIYNDRPDDCKFYPVTMSEMVGDGCEMLEKKDIDNPAQAQKMLDILMADSRSSFE